MTRRLAIALALTIVVSALVVSAAGKPPSGSALGAGTVVLPNPVADLGDETLTDPPMRYTAAPSPRKCAPLSSTADC